MFIAAQFKRGKFWKQPQCPLVSEWIKIYGTLTSIRHFEVKYQSTMSDVVEVHCVMREIAESKLHRVFFEAPIGLEVISQKT